MVKLTEMKNSIQIAMLMMVLMVSGCQQMKEGDTITTVIDQLSDQEDCQLGYLDQSTGNLTKLTITLGCNKEDDFFPGKIVLSAFEMLNKKTITRQLYSVNGKADENYGVFDFQQLKEITIKKHLFVQHITLMNDKNQLDKLLHNSLKEKTINEPWYSRMFESYKVKQKGWEFDGFVYEDHDTVSYVTFGSRLENEAIIWFSYQLREKKQFSNDDKLYGIGIIPL